MTPSHIEQVADRTGYWWLCIRCGRSGDTERTEARAKTTAEAHTCDPKEVAGASGDVVTNTWNGGGAETCSNCGKRLTRGIVQMIAEGKSLVANLCRNPQCERVFRRVHRDQRLTRWDTRSNPLSSLLSFGGGR